VKMQEKLLKHAPYRLTNWCTLLQYCKLDEWKIVVAMVDGSMWVDKPNSKYMTYNSIGNESLEGNYIGTS
jgi:hypothetical protein